MNADLARYAHDMLTGAYEPDAWDRAVVNTLNNVHQATPRYRQVAMDSLREAIHLEPDGARPLAVHDG